MPKLQLHTKIIIGLVLGAIFGSIFSINPYKLEIISNGTKVYTEHWSEFTFKTAQDSVLKSFDETSQIAIIRYYKGIENKNEIKAIVKYPNGAEDTYDNITYLNKITTIGVWLKPIGDIFVRLLTMIAVPLV